LSTRTAPRALPRRSGVALKTLAAEGWRDLDGTVGDCRPPPFHLPSLHPWLRPLQAHCHLGLGKLYRRIGRPDQARAELATAVVMLREMEMAFWLPEAERELAAAGG
jgi:hypothetical protein